MSEWLTLRQAALMLGIQPATLRQAIRDKRLTARKIGRDWFVHRDEVDRYERKRRKRS